VTGTGRPSSSAGQPGTAPAHGVGPVIPPAADRPASSIARALSGPDRIDTWQRRVRVVPGGQGPGQRDQETLDRDRARLPLTGPRRIVFLGCTSGAGQTITALMTGQLLAALRGDRVAAIDLNPGHGSLVRRAQAAPALTVDALLAGSAPPAPQGTGAEGRLDVITADADPAAAPVPGDRDYARLAEQAGRHYVLTMLDPGASEVTRVLGIANQLVLVAPASADAPRSLAMTQEWLNDNGHAELAARAVTVVNGVSKASTSEVEQAEAVARGRCRAIVRIPWDDGLAAGSAGPAGPAAPAGPTAPAGPGGVSSLRPQARHAYTALAGVLVAGLAAAPVPRKVLH
jgi:MinD-like ATPase involved in chromosome partitioning or flagellar assembly